MAKLFLRSGSLDDIFALGENGQPVYASALQIRESLRLTRNQAIADCLAIPQPNDTGDRIDWYSPIEGKVTSWSAASAVQRAAALRQLDVCLTTAADISQRALNAEKTARQLFGALLANAIRFPDQNYVYLVGDKPVITFWGFTSPQHKLSHDALASLRSLPQDEPHISIDTIVEEQTPLAPPIPPTSHDVPPELTIPLLPRAPAKPIARFWHHLAWLAGIMLLLFLALHIRDWLAGNGSTPRPAPLTPLTLENHGLSVDSASTAPVPAAAPPDAFPSDNVSSGKSAPSSPAQAVVKATSEGVTSSSQTAIDQSSAAAHQTAPILATTPGAPPLPGRTDLGTPTEVISKNALSLSADAVKKGSIAFLDGTWRVILNIQDPLTGKLPSLKYQFKQGLGTVKIVYGDSITCRANASAGLMKSGNLVINSRNKAKCSDGSRYQMPEIICKQGANGIAECTGRYNAETAFPMTIKREKE